MPQKAFEGGILHVRAMHIFPEMPHFSYLILKMGKMGHFRKNEHKKVGHFEKKARDRFENEKNTEIEHVRFWGISGKKCICHHVQNMSYT